MSRDDAHKLLGGYATGTLTPKEQQALFQAALEDQELFDALAREQALRDLLGDPTARAQLLAAVDDTPAPWYRRWWQPVPMTVLAAALAVAALVAVRYGARSPWPTRMAKLDLPVRRPELAPGAPLPPPPDVTPAPAAVAPVWVPGVSPTLPAPPAPKLDAKTAESITVSGMPVPAAFPAAAARGGAAQPRRGNTALGAFDARLAAVPQPDAQALFYGVSLDANSLGALSNRFVPSSSPPQGQAGVSSGAAPPPANLAIQYRVLWKLPDGDFADLQADGRIPAGTPVKLQITANNNGYLQIAGNGPDGVRRELVNRPLERMQPFETETWQYAEAGDRELQVIVSREPLQTASAAAPDQDVARSTVGTPPAAGAGGAAPSGTRQQVNYAANRDPAAQQVSVTITLHIQ